MNGVSALVLLGLFAQAPSAEETAALYRAGQPWAERGGATDACLVEINRTAPDPLDIDDANNREMVRVRAQIYAGLVEDFVNQAHQFRRGGALIILDVPDGQRVDRDTIQRVERWDRAAERMHDLATNFAQKTPSCLFLNDVR